MNYKLLNVLQSMVLLSIALALCRLTYLSHGGFRSTTLEEYVMHVSCVLMIPYVRRVPLLLLGAFPFWITQVLILASRLLGHDPGLSWLYLRLIETLIGVAAVSFVVVIWNIRTIKSKAPPQAIFLALLSQGTLTGVGLVIVGIKLGFVDIFAE